MSGGGTAPVVSRAPPGTEVDLANEAIQLMVARYTFSANAKVAKPAGEMQKALLDVNAAAASRSEGVVDRFATLRAQTSSRFCAAAMPETAIDNTLDIAKNSARTRSVRCTLGKKGAAAASRR